MYMDDVFTYYVVDLYIFLFTYNLTYIFNHEWLGNGNEMVNLLLISDLNDGLNNMVD